jgi:sugar/nucleoside kinase (ribokinase family)
VRPLAVLGNLSRDLIEGGARPGGGPFHAARALRLSGDSAMLVTKSATGDRDALLPPLQALGLPVRWHGGNSTATFAFDYVGDVRRMEVEALGDPWTPDDVRGWAAPALAKTEWVHVAPLSRSDFPAETLAALAQGRRILLDAQGLVRSPATGPLVLDDDYDPALLGHIAVLKLAEEEAQVVLDDFTEASVRRLGVPEVLLTLGSRGSIVYTNDAVVRVPARPVDVEPTGAGDGFSAAYVAARAHGHSPVTAARRATATIGAVLERRLAAQRGLAQG